MPCHPAELLVPRGGTPYSAAIGQHQHHLWHLISLQQPVGKKSVQNNGKYTAQRKLSELEIKPQCKLLNTL
jgi:hypothetical protein